MLRPGEVGVPWFTIEVVRSPEGWVALELTGAKAKSWTEKDGPPVHAPSRRSFGTKLIGSLGQQLKGEVRLAYDATGFVYVLDVPMASLVAPG